MHALVDNSLMGSSPRWIAIKVTVFFFGYSSVSSVDYNSF